MLETPEQAEQVREGTLISLEARRRFWEGVQSEVVAWRQPLALWTFLNARECGSPTTTNGWVAYLHNGPVEPQSTDPKHMRCPTKSPSDSGF